MRVLIYSHFFFNYFIFYSYELNIILYICIVKLLNIIIMREFVLRENVLTDNILIVADKGKIFKGGYIAIIKENRFKNAWADEETITRFRNLNRLNAYLDKHYSDVDLDFSDTCLEN